MTLLMALIVFPLAAQQYSGMTGLVHVPSAEMDTVGDARIGAHFLNRHFLPDCNNFKVEGKPYDSFDFYLSLTPFCWVEVALTMTLEKGLQTGYIDKPNRFTQKDRYISLKFRPLAEGRWHPAVAIGGQDCFSFGEKGFSMFSNFYIALTKHIDIKRTELGATLVYRKFTKGYNHRWNGVVGGVTCRPAFARNLRVGVEWTGSSVIVGLDCLLWRHLLLQASLQDGRYPSAGICYVVNLF